MADNTRNDGNNNGGNEGGRKSAPRKTDRRGAGERKPRAQAKKADSGNERKQENERKPNANQARNDKRGSQQRRSNERRDRKQAGGEREGFNLGRLHFDARNKNLALGTAAVLTAGIAGALYATWRHHADELEQMARSLFNSDDEHEDETTETDGDESANVEGATFATNGTTPKTPRRAKAARDVPPSGAERDAFAPATVPVAETERTDSPLTA